MSPRLDEIEPGAVEGFARTSVQGDVVRVDVLPGQDEDGEVIAQMAGRVTHGAVEVMVQRSVIDGAILVEVVLDKVESPTHVRVVLGDETIWDGTTDISVADGIRFPV